MKKLYINNLVILIYQLLTIKRDTQIVEKKLIYKEFLTSTLSPGPGLGHGHGWACNRTLLQSPLCPCQSISKISLGNCLLRHGRSTLLTTAQQCADGFVFGTFFLRWSVHCDIKPASTQLGNFCHGQQPCCCYQRTESPQWQRKPKGKC